MAKIYCLYDTVAEESGMLFEARTDALAHRIYETMDEKALPPGAKREDFKLMKLGSYFHGDGTKKPQIYGLSSAYDITYTKCPTDDDCNSDEKEAA